MIISIETSFNNFSLTLLNNYNVINHISVPFQNELSEIIVPTIKRFLNDSSISFEDISFLVVGCGPGSFTGIRSVISAALGIKISNDHIKSIGINSLAGLATSALKEARNLNIKYIISSIESKRDDLFIQLYKLNEIENGRLPFSVMNNISAIKIDKLYDYILSNKLTPKDILFVGYQSDIVKKLMKDICISKKFKQNPDSFYIGELASFIIKNKVDIDSSMFVFEKFKPVYARSPQINLK